MAGLCFYGTVTLSQYGIQSVQGALFILITENTFAPMYSALTLFPQRYPLFMRERQAGLYNTFQYYFTSIVALVRYLNMCIWDEFFERIDKKNLFNFWWKKILWLWMSAIHEMKEKRCKQIPTTYIPILIDTSIYTYTLYLYLVCALVRHWK